jgi:tripartite-type tricarboxylate transporter receptor subunit TctC
MSHQSADRPSFAIQDKNGFAICAVARRTQLRSIASPIKRACRVAAHAVIALSIVVGTSAKVHSESYPTRTITLVVPFSAGGGADTLARPLVERLKEHLGQPIIIDNRGGGGTNIGNSTVAKSTPDGYTLLINTDSVAALSLLYDKLPYDPIGDLLPIGYVARAPMVIAINSKVPINTVQELVEKAKQDSSSLNFANFGFGTPHHLAFEVLCRAAGIKINQVGYRGAGPALSDIVSGHVQFGVFTLGAVLPQLEAGNVRALAILSDRRYSTLPNVPTIAEAGYKDAQGEVRFILFAPKGTSSTVVNKLNKALESSMASSQMASILARNAYEPLLGSSEEVTGWLRDEHARWSPVVKQLGLRLN